jgi:DNA-binding IclR family transcriptional regulator
MGEYRYLHATASGKLLLAYHAPLLLEEVIATTGLPAVTNKTVTSLPKLRRELISIRQNGIAWNFEESTRGAGACAAPIYDGQGLIIGAVNTVYPLSAVNKNDFAAIATKVRDAGKLISNSMGWIGTTGSTPSRDISIARNAHRGKIRVPTSVNA